MGFYKGLYTAGAREKSGGRYGASGIHVDMIGDEELMRALTGLEYKLQHKILKKIVRDAANKTVVKALRQATPTGPTGNLKRSMGVVTGRSKRNAIVFVGPRMSTGTEKRATGKYSGWVANIIEFNKGQLRYPGTDRRGVKRKRPRTPDGVRMHSGKMPTTHRGYIHKTIRQSLPLARDYMAKSIRTIFEREVKRHVKKMGL